MLKHARIIPKTSRFCAHQKICRRAPRTRPPGAMCTQAAQAFKSQIPTACPQSVTKRFSNAADRPKKQKSNDGFCRIKLKK
ncbi:MAG: hypothetical protein H7273_00080 [Polaromonas sp.]|nr:hypothetical protein [Polaromonas sp.]